MKTLRAIAALAFLLACTPAFAQWQTPNHSVPLGRGPGVTGFGSAAPGTSGMPLVSQGASADPAFGTIGNSGFTAGAADTYKGSLNGTTVTDIPRAPCTSVSQALRYTAGVGESCGNIIIQTGFDMPVNLGLSVPAPSGGALIINLTQANGSAPTASSPVLVPFRSTSLTTGTVTWATISATQSITIPSGATLGTSSNSGSCANGSTCPFRVWIFEAYNGGTPELGVATCSSGTTIFACSSWEYTLVTSTTISSGAGTAGKLYATTGVSLDAVRIIGYCDFSGGLATAGSWASACTTLQVFGPGVAKPGMIVQTIPFPAGSVATVGPTTSPTTTNVTLNIIPTAAMNLVRISAAVSGSNGTSGDNLYAQVYRGSTAIGPLLKQQAASNNPGVVSFSFPNLYDAPGVATSTTYVLKGTCPAGTCLIPAVNTDGALETLEEIQG